MLCEVCGNARLSGFCCESQPPIAVLIPDALPNDTETEEPSRGAEKGGQGREKVTGKLQRLKSCWRFKGKNYDLILLTKDVADMFLQRYSNCDFKEMCMCKFWLCVCVCVFTNAEP